MLASLRIAYDAAVEVREGRPVDEWKGREREGFLELLRREDRRTLLEVGAGTGVHGRFFADEGLQVVCTDASPAMVDACRAKGLDAFEADFLSLDESWSFDAAFAMNCLLHVPPGDLVAVFGAIAGVLRPAGLAYVGQYGGTERTGVFDDDVYEPKRYFSSRSDDALCAAAAHAFDIVDFHAVNTGIEPDHFQALTLRKLR